MLMSGLPRRRHPLASTPQPAAARARRLSRLHTLTLGALAGLLLVWASACSAGYQGKVNPMRSALNAGDAQRALRATNELLGVDTSTQTPAKLEGDDPLLLLERAVLLQTLGRHKDAVADFKDADAVLEVLDLSADNTGALGKYLFSDDSTLYKAPPHEKLLVNTLAMLSYLTLGDIEGAKVEARRLNVLQKYFEDAAPEEQALYGLGSFLAGFTFEASGDKATALRHYADAWDNRTSDELARVLAAVNKDVNSSDDAVAKALAQSPNLQGATPGPNEGLLLVVVQHGRAPFKRAERRPIGMFASMSISNNQMSAAQRARANTMIAKGALKWINFPRLVEAPSAYSRFSLSLNGQGVGVPTFEQDVRGSTIEAWRADEDTLMIAAFTRMVTRAIAGEATSAVSKGANLDKALFPGASTLLGLVVEGAMTAADTPDTRSWTTLPAYIEVHRVVVPAGTHTVRFNAVNRPLPKRNRRGRNMRADDEEYEDEYEDEQGPDSTRDTTPRPAPAIDFNQQVTVAPGGYGVAFFRTLR